MNLQSRVARLDDASGELTLSLHKLEMEAARGVPNPEEQIDFLHDLHRAVVRKELHPWRTRALRAAVAGGVLVLGALLLPPGLAHREIAVPATAGLGGLALVGALVFEGVYLRALRKERRWLRHEEAEILGGHLLVGPR